jgi:hypothetical protein
MKNLQYKSGVLSVWESGSFLAILLKKITTGVSQTTKNTMG